MPTQLESATLSQSIPKVLKEIRDPKRLEALLATSLVGSAPEQAFDRFTALASRLVKVPVTTVTLVDQNQQFFKSAVGLSGSVAAARCTPLSHSFCKYVVASAAPLIVGDARLHPLLRDNGAVEDLNVIAYLGMPLTTRDGHTLGSFCAIDNVPRQWTQDDIATMRDLAGFIVSEIELRLLARHFQKSYLHTRQLEMERDELVHMLVHDLRNPLSSLLAGLELVKDADDADEAHRYADLASSGAQTLLHMVNDILDVSKAEAGRMTLQAGPVSARELIGCACGMVADMGLTSGVTLDIDADADLPLFEADREKLRRVLVNLISNAIQYTPRNGCVTVSARLDVDRIAFSVADTGKGIPVDAFSQIFEKFGACAARHGGRMSTGLGLHFCKTAIEAHGGQITVESQLGKGTTFRFDVPLHPKA